MLNFRSSRILKIGNIVSIAYQDFKIYFPKKSKKQFDVKSSCFVVLQYTVHALLKRSTFLSGNVILDSNYTFINLSVRVKESVRR